MIDRRSEQPHPGAMLAMVSPQAMRHGVLPDGPPWWRVGLAVLAATIASGFWAALVEMMFELASHGQGPGSQGLLAWLSPAVVVLAMVSLIPDFVVTLILTFAATLVPALRRPTIWGLVGAMVGSLLLVFIGPARAAEALVVAGTGGGCMLTARLCIRWQPPPLMG